MAPFDVQDPEFETNVRRSFSHLTLMHTLGARLVSVTPAEVEIDLPFRDDLTQHHGFLAAAVLTAIVDVACGYAALSVMPADREVDLWTVQRTPAIFCVMSIGKPDVQRKSDVLQGTLDLMILKTLEAMGPLHGFGIARRLEQVSEEVLRLNEGTVYTSLMRLQQAGWITAKWGASENNRKARFYSITKSGRTQLAKETEDWQRISGVIGRVLRLEGQKS